MAGGAASISHVPAAVMDFGCGTGSSTPFLLALPGAGSLVGVDVSARSLEQAARDHGSDRTRFLQISDYRPQAAIDLAFCNGVFHHIPPADRAAAVRFVHGSLRCGGLFAFWENNPWNPGTRYVMSRIPFDRDAITLTPPEARALLQGNGFGDRPHRFPFISAGAVVPRRRAARVPASAGAQYQILARRPYRARGESLVLRGEIRHEFQPDGSSDSDGLRARLRATNDGCVA